MYTHYVETKRWKVEVINADETGIGGMKEVEFMVKGQGAYSILKYESGVHRVQRVPETESGGRIHTSTASVAVMPEAEEVDVHIDEKDIRIDVMRASGMVVSVSIQPIQRFVLHITLRVSLYTARQRSRRYRTRIRLLQYSEPSSMRWSARRRMTLRRMHVEARLVRETALRKSEPTISHRDA